MTKVELNDLFKNIEKVKVAVIGDVMLDTYWWGHVERISPEAPVPVVSIDRREQRLGGAGNVALNLRSLTQNVSVLSVIGNDDDGSILRNTLKENNIEESGFLVSKDRLTTNKIRIISRNQQMMRLDSEHITDLNANEQADFFTIIENFIHSHKPDVIILQDYNKGVLTEQIIQKTIALCKKENIITAVDPKRKNFFTYKGVTLFKPNLKEVRESLNLLSEEVTPNSLNQIHSELNQRLEHQISLITLSEKGMYFRSENTGNIIPSHRRNIADVSGAGDTVIAVAALVYAASNNINLMAEIANIAGGLVCEEVGTAIINKSKLIEESERLIH